MAPPGNTPFTYVFGVVVVPPCPQELEYQTPPLDLYAIMDIQPSCLVQIPLAVEKDVKLGMNISLRICLTYGVKTICIVPPPSKPTLVPFANTSETFVLEPNEADPLKFDNSEMELLLMKYT